MNEEELSSNKQATEYVVHDLNLEPALPFPDNTFDVVTNAVSVDYLNKPLEVCLQGRVTSPHHTTACSVHQHLK